jgi:hypothetical protein
LYSIFMHYCRLPKVQLTFIPALQHTSSTLPSVFMDMEVHNDTPLPKLTEKQDWTEESFSLFFEMFHTIEVTCNYNLNARGRRFAYDIDAAINQREQMRALLASRHKMHVWCDMTRVCETSVTFVYVVWVGPAAEPLTRLLTAVKASSSMTWADLVVSSAPTSGVNTLVNALVKEIQEDAANVSTLFSMNRLPDHIASCVRSMDVALSLDVMRLSQVSFNTTYVKSTHRLMEIRLNAQRATEGCCHMIRWLDAEHARPSLITVKGTCTDAGVPCIVESTEDLVDLREDKKLSITADSEEMVWIF